MMEHIDLMSIKNIIPTITILIHGTRPTEMTPQFFSSITNSIEQVLFVDKDTTKLISSTESATSRPYLFELAKNYSNATNQNMQDFYFFSWSGKLDPKARKKAAELLSQEIERLLATYARMYTEKPRIDIIAHSHGGNVALLLANQKTGSFSVEHLVLLGCPIQLSTKSLVSSPIFKQVYNIHSHNDWIQVLDPQGIHILFDQETYSDFFGLLNNFFSARHFDDSLEKLKQANVLWAAKSDQTDPNIDLFPRWLSKRLQYASKLPFKRGLFHIEFTMLPFVKRLPELMKNLEHKKEKNGKVDIEIVLQ